MKRLAVVIVLLVLLAPGLAFSAEQCYSSGTKTSSAAIATRAGTFCGIAIFTNGSANAVVSVYDNATAGSGTLLFGPATVAAASNFGGIMGLSVPTTNGIYVTLSGTGASFIVYYRGQ